MDLAENVREVAEGIYQVILPLPFALSSVNCYLLRDDNGWTIIDSGLHLPQGRAGWQAAFASLDIAPGAITQVMLTHFHPDHYGMAGWLQRFCHTDDTRSSPTVWMSPREAELARLVWQLPDNQPEPMVHFFRAWGIPEDLTRGMAEGVAFLRARTMPHPSITLLAPGAVLRIGARRFTAIHTPGHSDGHLVFYDAEDRLILCGDHVLAKITPHIGLWPESEPDPLGRYLASLSELGALDIRLALPGHGRLIIDWQGRLAELQRHHDERLQRMEDAVGTRAIVYEVSTRVFDFAQLTPHEARFALAETLSHLEHLVHRGKLRRDDSGPIPVFMA